MKVLFDINHPAHVHVFKNVITELAKLGHSILVTSRAKECALPLLRELGVENLVLSSDSQSGFFGLLKELVTRDWKLLKVVLKEKPDVMLSIGGTFIAHVGLLTRIPSLVVYDTENAKLQNLITYPFATKVIVPDCYEAWVPKNKTERYSGYHELAYLHPNYFEPSKEIALENGLADHGSTFLVRVVAWNANHDIGEQGWTEETLRSVVRYLEAKGKVILSSEGQLPKDLELFRYRGEVSALHHVLAYCRLYVGESATIASEAAVLGVPAVYAAQTGRGYTNEQQRKYGLVKNVFEINQESIVQAIDEFMQCSAEHFQEARRDLLSQTIDVAEFLTNQALAYQSSKKGAH